jgi:hypothetical protein
LTSLLRRALTLLRLPFVLLQGMLVLFVFLLFAAWLHVPDSSIPAFAASVLLAGFTLALALLGEALLLRRLRALSSTRGDLLRGAIAILLVTLLWFGWSALLDHQSLSNSLRAGYWNSRFPHSLRNLFSYVHLLMWIQWLWASLQWAGTGLLLAIAVAAAQTSHPARTIVRVWRSGRYWLLFLISAIFATKVTEYLLHWTPGHGLRIEVVSLVLRLGTATIVDLLLTCFILATLTALVERADDIYSTPDGIPETSQPRATEIP